MSASIWWRLHNIYVWVFFFLNHWRQDPKRLVSVQWSRQKLNIRDQRFRDTDQYNLCANQKPHFAHLINSTHNFKWNSEKQTAHIRAYHVHIQHIVELLMFYNKICCYCVVARVLLYLRNVQAHACRPTMCIVRSSFLPCESIHINRVDNFA